MITYRHKSQLLKAGIFLFLSIALASSVLAFDVGVYVEYPDGKEDSFCINGKSGDDGKDILEKTSLDLTWKSFSGMGYALCKIDDYGLLEKDCLGTEFWNVWKLVDGKFEHSPVGLSSLKIKSNDVIALSFGKLGKNKPSVVSIEELCNDKKEDKEEKELRNIDDHSDDIQKYEIYGNTVRKKSDTTSIAKKETEEKKSEAQEASGSPITGSSVKETKEKKEASQVQKKPKPVLKVDKAEESFLDKIFTFLGNLFK